MRPILMKGHERPLTFLKYNRGGDLLFSCAKDHTPTVWFADSGERLGSYRGHNGAVWADNGERIGTYRGGAYRGHNGAVWCCDVSKSGESILVLKGHQGRVNRAVWGPLNKTIISGGEDSVIRIWDSETGKLLKESDKEAGHKKGITSLAKSNDLTYFITGSLDKSAKLWDMRTLTLLKTYTTERPVNAVAMSPLLHHVVLGGGQDASAVTTTDHRAGKFEAKFYDKVLQEEIGGVKGHFGPINALAFNPDGKSFASGGEDGYVRLHHFDPDYFNIKI